MTQRAELTLTANGFPMELSLLWVRPGPLLLSDGAAVWGRLLWRDFVWVQTVSGNGGLCLSLPVPRKQM